MSDVEDSEWKNRLQQETKSSERDGSFKRFLKGLNFVFEYLISN